MISFKDKQIALISDIHLGVHQDSSNWHDTSIKFAEWLNKELKKRGILDIVIPGDVFHHRSEISVNTISVAHKFFSILQDYNIIITVGNHDCFYKDRADVNSASILKGWTNIVVVDEIKTISAFNKKITFVPWAADVSGIEYSDLIFGHFELNSFYHNNFKICQTGMATETILNKGNTIITGHFHKTELREYNDGKILYVGSPYQQTFADVGCINGCYILDISTLKIIEFIENNISPKHIKIKISECIDGIYDLNKLREIIPNNVISFVVDRQISPEQANLFASKLHTLKPFSLRIDFNYEQQSFSLEKELDFTFVDIPSTIEEYVNSLNVENKEETISYLYELYKKVV